MTSAITLLINLLNAYASWTLEPSWNRITDSKGGSVDATARRLQDGTTKMAFMLMPGVRSPTGQDGVRGKEWDFEFWFYYFDKTLADANRAKCETFLDELDACLKASTCTGYDDNKVDGKTDEMTDRGRDHFLYIGNIVLRDDVV
jgi:hypothetical protein